MNATKRPLLTVRHDTENDETHIVREGEPIATIWRTQPDYEEFADQFVRAVNSYDELLADREYMKQYREAYCHQVTVIQAMREALELAVVLHPYNVTFTKALALAKGESL